MESSSVCQKVKKYAKHKNMTKCQYFFSNTDNNYN